MSEAPKHNPFSHLMRALDADSVMGGGVKIVQPKTGYRAAIDPVLLAAAADVKSGQTVLDVGCGVGTVALCVLARMIKSNIAPCAITGIDLQPALVTAASESAELNQWQDKIRFIAGDIGAGDHGIAHNSIDHIVTNPPYMAAGTADPSPDPIKAAANIESTADLRRWIEFCTDALRSKGILTMIHRADRMAEIVQNLRDCHFHTIHILPIYPKLSADAKRIIVKAVKTPVEQSRILPGLVLHHANGGYTDAANAILQGREKISWDE